MFTSEQLDALQAAAEAAKTDLDGPAWMRFWDHLTEDTIIGLVERLRAAETSLCKERRRGDAHMRSDHETGQHNMQLLARIARVEALHVGEPVIESFAELFGTPKLRCVACGKVSPCPTVRALTEGEPNDEH